MRFSTLILPLPPIFISNSQFVMEAQKALLIPIIEHYYSFFNYTLLSHRNIHSYFYVFQKNSNISGLFNVVYYYV